MKRWQDELVARGYGDVNGSVCLEHITDGALAGALRAQVAESDCRCCNREVADDDSAFAVPMEALVEQVVNTIRRHYATVDDAGVPWDSEDGYMGAPVYDIGDVVNEICSGAFDDEAADDLIEAIITAIGWDNEWTDYGALSSHALDYHWAEFSRVAQTTSRFVILLPDGDETDDYMLGSTQTVRDRRRLESQRLRVFLSNLLHYVDGHLGLLDEVSAGAEFYRGRLMDRRDGLEPTVRELRPAPSRKASANRMSPAGIPMFYASADPQTAIAEIAGHGPEPYAMIGRFLSTRTLTLLDLTRAPAMPSYFDESRHAELRMALFFRSFVAAITRPVIPDGRQHVEYTPTQVITEYLRLVPETAIDGIALPSSQTGEKTYVLFFDGSDCAAAEELTPDGTRPLRPQLASIGPDEPPALTLARGDVRVWGVRRTYGGEALER